MRKTLREEKYAVKKNDNLYSLFNVDMNADFTSILKSYSNHIVNYILLHKDGSLNSEIEQIKTLKLGLYILSRPNLRENYNKSLGQVGEPEALDGDNFTHLEQTNAIKVEHSEMSNRAFEFSKRTFMDDFSRKSIQTRDNDKLQLE